MDFGIDAAMRERLEEARHIGRTAYQRHSNTHIKSIVHYFLFNRSLYLYYFKDLTDRP